MRRTRLTIATFSMAAAAMVLGVPAATAATAVSVSHPVGHGQVQVVADDSDDSGSDHRRHERRRHHVRRRHHLRWHHRCGRGWDSGWVSGMDRDKFRDRDRFDHRDGDGDRVRDRDFRDDGDRGWGRGWISKCDWHRGEHRESSYAAPRGAVKAGEGGSVTNLSTPELAAGGSLAALGLAGVVGAMRRRSSSR